LGRDMAHLDADGTSGTRSPRKGARQLHRPEEGSSLRRKIWTWATLALAVTGCAVTADPPAIETARRVETTQSSSPTVEATPKVDQPMAPDSAQAPQPNPAEIDPAPLRLPTEWSGDRKEVGPARDQGARARRMPAIEQLFADAGVSYPAAQVLFRVFKKENKLEVWANDKKGTALKPIATYGICYASGDVGPKRHEGDLQVPEGFYKLSYIWADTDYHLAMYVSYPNVFDRRESPTRPGGDILIHGSCVSIGCISMSDERIEELWTIVQPLYARGDVVELHVFPSRDMKALMDDPKYAEQVPFWRLIEPAREKFDTDHLIPKISFDGRGNYTIDGKSMTL
jgi:L,D-transpeptidase catalytic domain